MATCPNGHESTTADYCDQCGAPMAAPPVAASAVCPNCQSARGPDEKFCEVCGFDFVTGTLPAGPAVTPVPSVSVPGPRWQAVVTADREYYDRNDVDDIDFPDHCPERMFFLTQDEILIGRHSEARGVHPQIDLSGAPEDTGISRSHAILRRQPDGSFGIIDPGSTNGTTVNDTPLAPNVLTPLKDGDCVYLGAWTKIVVHAL
jgi:hypothetical protein